MKAQSLKLPVFDWHQRANTRTNRFSVSKPDLRLVFVFQSCDYVSLESATFLASAELQFANGGSFREFSS